MKILYFCIYFIAITSCTQEKINTSKTATVEINLAVLSRQLQSSSFTISNIQLFNDKNIPVPISEKSLPVNWVNGQKSSLYLVKTRVPEGVYTDIALTVTLNNQSFVFIDDQIHNLFMVDSLNRTLSDDINTFSLRTNLSYTPIHFSNDQTETINLIFDADKSVQPLYKEESTTALFKPYFYTHTAPSTSRHFYATFVDSNFDTLSLSTTFSHQPIHIPLSQISEITLDGSMLDINAGINHLLHNKEDLIQVIDNKTFSLHIYAKENRLNSILASIRVAGDKQTLEGQILDGNQKITGSDIKLNPETLLFSPKGTAVEKNLNRLLNGQLVTGFITEEKTVLHLRNSELIAVIKSIDPTTITPLTYNNYPVRSPSHLSVALGHLTSIHPGDFIALDGYALGDTFYTTAENLLDKNQASFSMTLPSSLSQSPVSHILQETTFVLSPRLSDIAHTVLSIDNTPIQTSANIEYIDTQQATFSIYSDRVLESKWLYRYATYSDALNAIKTHLLDAHHINEIHAKGLINDNVLHASEIHIVFYGPSTLDALSTDQALIDIEEEASTLLVDNSSGTKSKKTKNNTALIAGLTLTLGVPLLVAGVVYLLFKKGTKQTEQTEQPILVATAKEMNLSPIDSPKKNKNNTSASTKPYSIIKNGQEYQVVTLDTGEVFEFPITDQKASQQDSATNKKPKTKPSQIITENGMKYEVITLESGEILKFPMTVKPATNKPATTQKTKALPTFIMNYQGGRILKINNALYFEQIDSGQKILSEVIKLAGSNDYVSAERTAEDHVDLNLNEWFLKKYPRDFLTRGNETILFNDIEIQDIIDNRAMIDTELAVIYLSAFSKKHNDLLYFTGLAENNYTPNSNQNAIITAGAIDQDFGDAHHGGDDTKTRLENFINGFSESNKKFAVLPALGVSKHFNALILVKDDTTKAITPILIEPGDGSIAQGISQEVKNLLPQQLQQKTIILQTNIQTDGCSCGPIAMVTAADIISKIQERNMTANEFTLENVTHIVNELKTMDKYKAEDQHPRIRIDMLRTLDAQKIIKQSPLSDVEFTHKINTFKPRKI